MSAFMHATEHIDASVDAIRAASGGKYRRTILLGDVDVEAMTSTEIGRVLIHANAESVMHRYADSVDHNERAEYAEREETYRHTPCPLTFTSGAERLATYVRVLDSLDYQSCEVPDWEQTPVGMLLASARQALLADLVAMFARDNAWSLDANSLRRSRL